MTMQPGQVLNNRYRIVKILGQGGMGRVYRAWDLNLKNSCALKENLDLSPESTGQFEQEAQILANLHHPNLPRVIDTFQLPGQGQYLVMDFIEGDDLETMLARTGSLTGLALPEAQVVTWVLQICDALAYLHKHNPPVIHRDVKPANIRINPEGKAVLVDFGISKLFKVGSQTTRGARAATPGYAPPEQFGLGNTDERSDIYALGATLYSLLTGLTPPPALDVVSGGLPPPQPANQVNPQVSPGVSASIERAMQLNRAQRFSTAGEFAAALRSSSPETYRAESHPGFAPPGQAAAPYAGPPVSGTPTPQPVGNLSGSGALGAAAYSAAPVAGDVGGQRYAKIPAAPARPVQTPRPASKSRRALPIVLLAILATCITAVTLGVFLWRSLAQPVATQAPLEPTLAAEVQETVQSVQQIPPTQPPDEQPTEQPTEAPAQADDICASGQTYRLTVWHNLTDDGLSVYEAAGQEYSRLHPCVTLESFKPENLENQLLSEVAGGGGPDLVNANNDRIGDWVAKDVIVDLDQFGIDQDFLAEVFHPVAGQAVTLNGNIYGLPENMENIALIYNRDLDLEAFLPPDPYGFDILYDKASQFIAERGFPLVCNSGLSGADAYHSAPVFFGSGMPQYIDEDGQAYLDSSSAQSAGEWIQKFRQVSPPEADYNQCQAAFESGQVGMWWTGPWAIKDLTDKGLNLGIVSMGRPFVSTRAFMLTKAAVDRGVQDAALDFIKFATSGAVQTQLAETTSIIPANLEALRSPAIVNDPLRSAFAAQAGLGVPMANHIYSVAQWTPVGDAVKAIWNGSLTVEEALRIAQEQILAEIARINGG